MMWSPVQPSSRSTSPKFQCQEFLREGAYGGVLLAETVSDLRVARLHNSFMSSQVHVALSSKIKGAGVVAGGPYFCTSYDFQQISVNYEAPRASLSGNE
jgi:hypothetical protein